MFGILGRREKTEEGLRRTRESWFGRLKALFQGPRVGQNFWEELEELLIAADAGTDTTSKLLAQVRASAPSATPGEMMATLKKAMVNMLSVGPSAYATASPGRPWVVLVVGVNGTGKTTSIAKLAHYYKSQRRQVILGAADTFRAAAVEQLQAWGQRVAVPVIAQRQGSDPGAVAFDALQAAQARGADVLIVDTAGRLHTKQNLMEELKKVRRVLSRLDPHAPHETLLVLDATVGQNGLAQARQFAEAMEITGIFLAKLDGTAKGGIVLAICDQLRIPVRYLGTGEHLDDMAPFEPEEFVEALFSGPSS